MHIAMRPMPSSHFAAPRPMHPSRNADSTAFHPKSKVQGPVPVAKCYVCHVAIVVAF